MVTETRATQPSGEIVQIFEEQTEDSKAPV
jgi:hypothetical protein